MNDHQNSALQYMRDVGVPDADVAWLADFRQLPAPASTKDITRAKKIEDAAYYGLLGTIKNHQKSKVCQ